MDTPGPQHSYQQRHGWTNVMISLAGPTMVSLMFVVSLYIWPKHRRRSQPATIIRRFISILVSSIMSVCLVFWVDSYVPGPWSQLLNSLNWASGDSEPMTRHLYPAMFTLVLFISPLIDDLRNNRTYTGSFNQRFNASLLYPLRNYIVAPLFEELVYRAINCSLFLIHFSQLTTIILSALLFGLSHFHNHITQYIFDDVERQTLTSAFLQMVYTSLFGAYVASIYIKSHSLWAPVIVHAACNFVGAPQAEIFSTKSQIALTIFGSFSWIFLFYRYMTY